MPCSGLDIDGSSQSHGNNIKGGRIWIVLVTTGTRSCDSQKGPSHADKDLVGIRMSRQFIYRQTTRPNPHSEHLQRFLGGFLPPCKFLKPQLFPNSTHFALNAWIDCNLSKCACLDCPFILFESFKRTADRCSPFVELPADNSFLKTTQGIVNETSLSRSAVVLQ